jgi:hypothetical protein
LARAGFAEAVNFKRMRDNRAEMAGMAVRLIGNSAALRCSKRFSFITPGAYQMMVVFPVNELVVGVVMPHVPAPDHAFALERVYCAIHSRRIG